MKLFKTAAFAIVFALLFIASDCRSPSDPGGGAGGGGGEVAASFQCLKEQAGNVLRCSDETSGGAKPYRYQWSSSFLNDPADAWRQATVVFNYTEICERRNQDPLSVTTNLAVTDDSGRSSAASDSFLVCVP